MKHNFFLLCLVSAILLTFSVGNNAFGVTANPNPVRFTQPDGSSLTIILKGDEFIHWAVTSDGYTLLSNTKGAYEYARLNTDGSIGFSGIQANDPDKRASNENDFLNSTQKGLFFSKSQIVAMKQLLKDGHAPLSPLTGGFPHTGVRSRLTILVNFSNTTTTYTQANYDNMMNQVNYNGTGSFKDYYLEVSYGQLTVNTTVTVWVTLSHVHDYYGPESMWGQFALDAVTAANSQTSLNFANFDNDGDGVVDGVCIIHQGRGQEESGNTNDIWSHSWELSSAGFSTSQCTFDGVLVDAYTAQPERGSASTISTIGVMCHEFGHNLGAPDFYDTDYSTNGSYDGTGDWDIMASGSWNGNSGDKPAHHNAYTKAYIYGWTTPVILTTAQSKTLAKAETSTDVVRYNTPTTNEYFICENRQQTGFDAAIPGHGLIIFHVDGSYIAAHSSANNINAGSHQGLYPVCASATGNPPSVYGTINGTGCPFPGTGSKTTFSDATTPNSHSWAGASTGYPLTTITENTTTKEITFCFISCSATLSVTPSVQNVIAAPGTTPFTVTTTAAWTATSNQAWCTVTPSGTGNGTVTATYTQNTTAAARSATITVTVTGVTPVTVTVTQAAPTLSVSPSDQPVTPVAGTTPFTVTSNSLWTATSNQGWCTVTPSGTGSGTITATYTQNTTASSRVATITTTVSGLTPVTTTVTQAAPTLSVTPSTQSVTASAGTTPFTVTSNSTWTCTSDQSWCVPTASGTGSGTITATYTANALFTSRVATLTVTVPGLTPVTVTVNQAGVIPTLSLTPANQPVSPASGTTSFTVTSNTSWTATSSQGWCTVTPSGSGNGTITANYTTNNTTLQRVASITVTVTGLTPIVVTVTQAAPTLSVTPSTQSVTYLAGNTSFTVTSNTSWTATSDQSWCTATPSGSGNGSITATYTLNPTYVARVANITVSVTGLSPITVTVSQDAAPAPEFNYTILNDVQTSDRTLEFDLYLLDTQPSIPLQISLIQAGILVNSGIIGGGTITTMIVPGYSDLLASQQPANVIWATGSSNGCIKITPSTTPACGNGSIISTTGYGSRVCRVRITNSLPFTASSHANLTFNFTTSPYPTKVYQFTGTPCISSQMTTNATNCFSLASNILLNGPPVLSVSPGDQPVAAAAGTIPFTVTSNASWTATSNQSWCSVTPSGYGNGTIIASFTENTASPRVASITVTVTGLTPVVVTVSQAGPPIRTLNLSLFLEGLYIGENTMQAVMDESGFHWGPTIADKLTIELHSGADYSTIVYSATDVTLNTAGVATFTLPSSYNGNYYVTVLNRNHILTTTAFPVSFSLPAINYTFDAPAKAYGDNMGLMIDGTYVFFAGDVNQDGIIDASDLSGIFNLANQAASGFLSEDMNGDGLIDASDLSMTFNNANMAVGSVTP